MKRCFVMLGMIVATSACESRHAAELAFGDLFQAMKYGDFQTFSSFHKDATDTGTYCSDAFKTVIDRARRERSDAECSKIESLSNGASPLPKEAQLAMQIYQFVCQVPDGTCREYGSHVLRSSFEAFDGSRLREFSINKVISRSDSAVIYVDLVTDDGTLHRSVTMENSDRGWVVSGGLL